MAPEGMLLKNIYLRITVKRKMFVFGNLDTAYTKIVLHWKFNDNIFFILIHNIMKKINVNIVTILTD